MNIPYAFRKCNKCDKWLVAYSGNFCRNKRGKYNLNFICKKCASNTNKIYRENNKEDIKRKKKIYRKNTKHHRKEYSKKYYEYNKENLLYKQNEYRKLNTDKIKEYHAEYYKNNKDYILNHNKEYINSPQGQVARFNHNTKRRYKEKKLGKGIDENQWLEVMNFFDWKCAYSNKKLSNKTRSIDHIQPLSKNGVNEIWNVVPMYTPYNSSKHCRDDVMNWYRKQDYFSEERLKRIVEWQLYAYDKWATEEDDELILIIDL